jgi:hypothetical protein
MSESALTEVLVSIQEAGPEHRHLAAGVLGDKDLVLIPAPPPEVLDPDHEFQVVTIPQPLASGYPVERLWAQCVNVLWNQADRERPVAAMVKLRQPSSYPRTMLPFNGGALGEQLERDRGDLWAALEALGIVRGGLRDGPPAEVLAELPALEQAQRRATLRNHDFPAPSDVGWSICRWLCICHPR